LRSQGGRALGDGPAEAYSVRRARAEQAPERIELELTDDTGRSATLAVTR
jgi:hypothetical protein